VINDFIYFRELINDQDFRHAVKEMENEPVPYYGMLTPDLVPLKDETCSPSLFTVCPDYIYIFSKLKEILYIISYLKSLNFCRFRYVKKIV